MAYSDKVLCIIIIMYDVFRPAKLSIHRTEFFFFLKK